MAAAARRQSIFKAAGNAGLLQEPGELSSGSSKASLKAGTPKKAPLTQQPASTPQPEPTKRCRSKTTPVPKQDQTPSTMTPAPKQAKPNDDIATPTPVGKQLVFDDAGTST